MRKVKEFDYRKMSEISNLDRLKEIELLILAVEEKLNKLDNFNVYKIVVIKKYFESDIDKINRQVHISSLLKLKIKYIQILINLSIEHEAITSGDLIK